MSDYIAEDNIYLILRHLPVKSLLRFRCVSKGWKETIDSPSFIQEHLSLQKPLFLVQDEDSPKYLVIDPHGAPSIDIRNDPIQKRVLTFLGTHHGVVCLDNGDLVLWNPSMRKFLTVPLPDYMDGGWEYIDIGTGCFGFWIDPSTGEFKFIILNSMTDDEDEPIGVLGVLYSSIQQDWRVIPLGEVGNWMPDSYQAPTPVMIRGVAHWRGHKYKDNAGVVLALPWYESSYMYENKAPGVILSFNFALEKFDYIPMPDLAGYPVICHWIGGLALVSRDERVLHRYDVYLWQDGLWVNMFGFYVVPPVSDIFWVLGEEERVRVLALSYEDLVLCDSKDGIITLLDDYSDPYVSADAQFAYDFVESLLFPQLTISGEDSTEYSGEDSDKDSLDESSDEDRDEDSD